MPSLTYTLHARIINWMRGVTFAPPCVNLKVGLFTTAPQPDGTGIYEPTDTGYTRQTIVLTPPSTAAGVTTTKNAQPVVFGPAATSWTPVNYLGVFGDDGALLFYGPLAAQRAPAPGDAVAFAASAIQLRLR